MSDVTALSEVKYQEVAPITMSLVEAANALVICDEGSNAVAVQMQKDAHQQIKRAQVEFKPLKDSAKKTYDNIRDLENRLIDPCKEVKIICGAKCVVYQEEQDAIAKEKQRKLDAEQRAREEEERKKAEAQASEEAQHAEKMGDSELAMDILEDAANYTPTNVIVPIVEAKKPDGMKTTEYWSAEVVSLMALVKDVAAGNLPISYLNANMVSLNQAAKAMKSDMRIAGVRAKCVKKMSPTGR